MLKYSKIILILLLTYYSVNSYGQEYEMDTIFRAESVETLPVSKFDGWSLEQLAKRYAFYPADAWKLGIDDTVVVCFIVYKNGTVADVKVVQSPDTLEYLDRAVVNIVNSFSLKPAIKDGKPVNVRIELPFEFHLREKDYERSFEEEKKFLEERHKYYVPNYALYIGRYYVSGQIGAFGIIDIDENDFLKNTKESMRICSFAEISSGIIFRDRRRIGFSSGLGFRSMRYYFDDAFNLKTSGKEVYADYSCVETDHFKQHFLQLAQITLPLGISYRFSFHDKGNEMPIEINLYATGTMLCRSREKQVYKIDDVKKKLIYKDDFLLQRFGFDLSLECLMETVGIKYTISPLPMFINGVTPKVYYTSVSFSFKIGIR